MAIGTNVTGISSLAEVLSERGLEGLGSAVEILINEAMRIERDRHLNAKAYERTESRNGYSAQTNSTMGIECPISITLVICK